MLDYFLNIHCILLAAGQAHENNLVVFRDSVKYIFVLPKHFWTVFIILVGSLFQHIIYCFMTSGISIVRIFILYDTKVIGFLVLIMTQDNFLTNGSVNVVNFDTRKIKVILDCLRVIEANNAVSFFGREILILMYGCIHSFYPQVKLLF